MAIISYCAELTLPCDSLITLDPTLVLNRLLDTDLCVLVCVYDYAWRDFDAFRARGIVESAVLVTERDARRRGPIWQFRIYGEFEPVPGAVERRRFWIRLHDQPLPPIVKESFLRLSESLKIPGATIDHYKLTGNDREPT